MSFGISYVDSTAGMEMISFAPITQEAADTMGFEDYDLTGVHEYSDLDICHMQVTGNVDVELSKIWGLYIGILYDDYQDDDPYLVDTTGNYYWLYGGLRFKF